jgi:hypothetical protein
MRAHASPSVSTSSSSDAPPGRTIP